MAEGGSESGDLTVSLIMSSDVLYDLCCDVCSEDGQNMKAEGFCVDCGDYLCMDCVKGHKKNRLSRDHTVQDNTQMPRHKPSQAASKTTKGVCTEKCADHHTRLVEYFCRDDRTLGCSVCMTLNHRLCEDVDHIPDVSENLLDSQEYKQLTGTLTNIKSKSQDVIKRSTENVTKAEKCVTDAADAMQELRKQMNKVFDEFEGDLRKKAEAIKQADIKKMKDIIDKGNTVYDEVEKISANLQSLRSKNHLGQLFIQMIKLDETVKKLLKNLADADIDNEVTTYTFQSTQKVQEVLSDPSSIGRLCIQHSADTGSSPSPAQPKLHGIGQQSPSPAQPKLHGIGQQSPSPPQQMLYGIGQQSPSPAQPKLHGIGQQSPSPPQQILYGIGQQSPSLPQQMLYGIGQQSPSPAQPKLHGIGQQSPSPPQQMLYGIGQQSPNPPQQMLYGIGQQLPSSPQQMLYGIGQQSPSSPQQMLYGIGQQSPSPPQPMLYGIGQQSPSPAQPMLHGFGQQSPSPAQPKFQDVCQFVKDINVKTGSDIGCCHIFGSELIHSSKLVLADLSHKKVKLLNLETSKVTSEVDMSSAPWDVAKLAGDEVAVTLPDDRNNQIMIVEVSDCLKLSRGIQVDGKCTAVLYRNGKLIVTFKDPVKIELMSLDGTVERKIQQPNLFQEPSHMSLSLSQATIYVADRDGQCIKKIALDGSIQAEYRNSNLNGPRGLAVDQHGWVLACGAVSKNIHLISPDLEHGKVLVTGLRFPTSLSYCQSTGRLYIGTLSDKVKMYQLS